jgi:aryl-alcohol dehydrogenase-like predicted oxidoreductase
MRYRKLGNIGLIVSGVALGTMQFGGRMKVGNLGQEDTTRMVKLALDGGINPYRHSGRVPTRGERDSCR